MLLQSLFQQLPIHPLVYKVRSDAKASHFMHISMLIVKEKHVFKWKSCRGLQLSEMHHLAARVDLLMCKIFPDTKHFHELSRNFGRMGS